MSKKKIVTTSILAMTIAAAGLLNPSMLSVDAASTVKVKTTAIAKASVNPQELTWPSPFTQRVTSKMETRKNPITGVSMAHTGIDISDSGITGTPAVAAKAGVVTHASSLNGSGNLVVIDHGKGVETRYAHLSGFNAKVGDKVAQGQVIGFVGNTGTSTGANLHFEIRLDGKAVDPLKYYQVSATKTPTYLTNDILDVHASNTMSSKVSFTIPKHVLIKVDKKYGTMYQVTYDGKRGYINGANMKEVKGSVKVQPDSEYATTAATKVLAAEKQGSEVSFTIPKNAQVTIIKKTVNGFYQVKYGEKTGFISVPTYATLKEIKQAAYTIKL